jgi:hypothetical protein
MHEPRHFPPARRTARDRRLGGWLITLGALLLSAAVGASLAGPLLWTAP